MRHSARALTAAAAAALCVTPLLMHVALSTGRWVSFTAVLAAIQVAAVGMIVLGGVPPRPRIVLALALAACTVAWQGSAEGRVLTASGIDHALIYGGLLALFAASLVRGRVDLVTEMATRTQGQLPPETARYTRRATWAWCGFFAGQLLISALLYAVAPGAVWSLFVNVLDLPLVIAMFALEYAVRRIVLRRQRHVSIAETVRAFARHRAGPAGRLPAAAHPTRDAPVGAAD